METERWHKLRELFGQALEIPSVDLPEFLDRTCGDDTPLRRELVSLLQADQRASDFFICPAPELQGPDARTRVPEGDPYLAGEALAILQRLAPDLPLVAPAEFVEQATTLSDECLAPGTVFGGRFRIRRHCGGGGFGEIYQAEDLTLGQDVALKLLSSRLSAHHTLLRRFANEVRIAREVTHPNVCRVFDIGAVDGIRFLSMEYVEGQDLAAWLAQNPRPALEQTLSLALQICYGLGAAHRRGIVHRDLKPSNLLIDRENTLRVTDFGLAVLADKVTGPESRNGTPAYMSPEQHLGLEATVRSDLYSVGLILYRLLVGQEAFAGRHREEFVQWHCEAEPVRPSELGIELPEQVEDILMACLAKDPDQRPASTVEIARALGQGTELRVLAVLQLTAKNGDSASEWLTKDVPALARLRMGRSVAAEQCWLFDRPAHAVRFALDCQNQASEAVDLRIALHFAEVQFDLLADSARPHLDEIDEVDLRITNQLAKAAESGQILLTRGVFDRARQQQIDRLKQVHWLAHGSYELRSVPQPLDLCEVGRTGVSRLAAPRESKLLRRSLIQERIAGWRPAPGSELPQRPGWTLERKLGEGGFGEVWLAANTSTRAVSTFKFCFDAARLRGLQRETSLFRLLKEVLGDRGDIVRLLDWNLEEAPYFIESEYSEGGSFLDWAAQQGGLETIPLDVRLDLVAQSASALAAAHSVGVLHKDIKPGNILILSTSDGTIKARLNDFGLGLITETDRFADAGITALGFTDPLASLSSEPTGGSRLYMAPELLEGKAATVQADIYALGVLLFQAIVGDFSRAVAVGWEREIDDDLLVEDIAAAIDGLPERRLADAQRLADRLQTLEVRRQRQDRERLQQQEVKAAREALARGRRRRNLFAVAAIVFLIFALSMLVQSRRVASEAATSEAALAAFENLLKGFDPHESPEELSAIGRSFENQFQDFRLELEDDTKVQARIFHAAARFFERLGLNEKAEDIYQEALEARELVYGSKSYFYAETLNALARVSSVQGKTEEAEVLVEEAFAITRRLRGEPRDRIRAESLEIRSGLLQGASKIGLARESFEESLKIRLESLGEADPLVAEARVRFGAFLNQIGKYDEAEAQLKIALEYQSNRFGDESGRVAETLEILAQTIQNSGNYIEPEQLFDRVLRIRRRAFGDQSPRVARTLHRFALLKNLQGDSGPAIQFLDEARSIYVSLYGESHTAVGHVTSELGKVYIHLRQYDKAQELYEETCALFEMEFGTSHTWPLSCQLVLGRIHNNKGEFQEAERIFNEVLRSGQASDGISSVYEASALQGLARVALFRGDLTLARTQVEAALDLLRDPGGDDTMRMVMPLSLYSDIFVADNQLIKAEQQVRRILEIYGLTMHPRHPRVAYMFKELAAILSKAGRLQEAELLARSAVDILKESLPANSWRVAVASEVLGEVLIHRGEYEQAGQVLLDARELISRQLSLDSRLGLQNTKLLNKVYSALGQDWASELQNRYRSVGS